MPVRITNIGAREYITEINIEKLTEHSGCKVPQPANWTLFYIRFRVRSERQIPGEYSTPAWNFRRKCRSESDSWGKLRGTNAESVESKKHLTRRSREDGGAHRYARVSVLLNINGYFLCLFPPWSVLLQIQQLIMITQLCDCPRKQWKR